MRCMAKRTIFGDWCMLPDVRPTHVGVTLVTGEVKCLLNQLNFGSGAMWAMTASTVHLAFRKRM